MKQEQKKQKPETYGLVSELQRVPLFDKSSDVDHTFARELYVRREKEVNECAAKAGFVKVSSENNVRFAKKK